ncbi:MAG TPA: YdbL family protein [Burkholderiales bacterium]|nr:YdbL family protein [Burkholderiales bacterium]
MIFPRLVKLMLLTAGLVVANSAWAQANLEINSPGVTAIREIMKQRHGELAPYYNNGAIGLTRDGNIALRDAAVVPLAQRAAVNSLITAANEDRASLYREIARANNHPEWEGDIRNTFAQRWIERAPAGWYYQNASGAWMRK